MTWAPNSSEECDRRWGCRKNSEARTWWGTISWSSVRCVGGKLNHAEIRGCPWWADSRSMSLSAKASFLSSWELCPPVLAMGQLQASGHTLCLNCPPLTHDVLAGRAIQDLTSLLPCRECSHCPGSPHYLPLSWGDHSIHPHDRSTSH